jgi:hypothetical protein
MAPEADVPSHRQRDRRPKLPLPTARLLTVAQFSMVYGVPQSSVRDLIRRGLIPCVILPGSRRKWIKREDGDRLIERSTECMS